MSQVENYKYLRSLVTKAGKYEGELLKRIRMAKTRFNKLRKALTNTNVSMQLRLRLLECFIWSVLVYGCEAWTLDQKLRRRLVAVEIWFLRRMLRLPWKGRLTNERVMEMVGVRRELLGAVKKRQLKFLGHLLRHGCLEEEVFLGKIEGRRARGRQGLKFESSLVEEIPGEMTGAGLVRLAQDRERRRSTVAHVKQDMAFR